MGSRPPWPPCNTEQSPISWIIHVIDSSCFTTYACELISPKPELKLVIIYCDGCILDRNYVHYVILYLHLTEVCSKDVRFTKLCLKWLLYLRNFDQTVLKSIKFFLSLIVTNTAQKPTVLHHRHAMHAEGWVVIAIFKHIIMGMLWMWSAIYSELFPRQTLLEP